MTSSDQPDTSQHPKPEKPASAQSRPRKPRQSKTPPEKKKKSRQPETEVCEKSSNLPARASVDASDGLSFSQGGGRGGPGLVPQEHGGALIAGGTPEGRAKGGRAAAEKRRARAERDDAIDDAMVGHVEKMSEIIADLVEEAGGKQYRCTCGVLGPKVPKLKLKEATEVAAILMRTVRPPSEATTVIPIQVNVAAGGQVMPYGLEVPADIASDEKMKSYLPAVWALVRRAREVGWVDAVVEVLEAAPQEATADG